MSLEELEACAGEFDAMVARTQGIDTFCSSTDWAIPAARALCPPRGEFIRRGAHGFAAFAQTRGPRALLVLEPLEAMWALGCPIVAADPEALLEELRPELDALPVPSVLVVAGVAPGSDLESALLRILGRRRTIFEAPPTRRCVAHLVDGADAYLARRSANFRRTLSRAERGARDAGIHFEACRPQTAEEAHSAWARILEVERHSWKGREGSGVVEQEMQDFYALMLPRLARRGALDVHFARQGERDIGFIVGATSGATYRGLQCSFDDDFRALSLGSLAQWTALRAQAQRGIRRYDLGTERAYKLRYADEIFETRTLMFVRDP